MVVEHQVDLVGGSSSSNGFDCARKTDYRIHQDSARRLATESHWVKDDIYAVNIKYSMSSLAKQSNESVHVTLFGQSTHCEESEGWCPISMPYSWNLSFFDGFVSIRTKLRTTALDLSSLSGLYAGNIGTHAVSLSSFSLNRKVELYSNFFNALAWSRTGMGRLREWRWPFVWSLPCLVA